MNRVHGHPLFFGVLLSGCTGLVGLEHPAGPSDAPEEPTDEMETNVGRVGDQALIHDTRRLNDLELRNTIRDLFGSDLAAGLPLPPALAIDGYDTYAEGLGVDEGGASTLVSFAEQVATAAAEQGRVPPCDLAASNAATCASAVLDAVGPRAFRRPLTPAERADRIASASAVAAELSANGTLTSEQVATELRIVVTMGLLASPHFLYKVDALGEAYSTIEHLRSYRFASRLSYLLWASMPDARLLDLAGTGALQDPAIAEAEVERMLRDPRAREPVLRFIGSWIELDSVDRTTKDASLFPDAATLIPLFKEETATFLRHAVFEESRTLAGLFQADYSFVNGPLASFYGVAAPATGNFEKTQMPPDQRKGLLTQAGFLAARSRPNQTSPIHRGAHIMKRLLCGELSPPSDLMVTVPEPMPEATLREQVEAQTASPSCAVCHKHFNGFGFALEAYDALGRFRPTDEQGLPLDEFGRASDTSATFPEGAAVEGSFKGAMDMIDAISESKALSRCFVRSYLRFALGRQEVPAEESTTVDALSVAFQKNGGEIPALLTLLSTHGAFMATE